MRSIKFSLAAAALALALGATASPAISATTLNVNWGDGCGKATCFGDDGVFTKTFSARDFTGPVTIGQLLMQRGVLGALDGYTFRISFALNGEEQGSWGHWNMAGINGEQLGFTGENFTWNPEDGDLVLILSLAPPPRTGGGGVIFAGALPEPGEEPFGEFEPFSENPGDGNDPQGPGLRGPNGQPGAIPEPATWAMMIAGFGMAGAILRRRRLARAV